MIKAKILRKRRLVKSDSMTKSLTLPKLFIEGKIIRHSMTIHKSVFRFNKHGIVPEVLLETAKSHCGIKLFGLPKNVRNSVTFGKER